MRVEAEKNPIYSSRRARIISRLKISKIQTWFKGINPSKGAQRHFMRRVNRRYNGTGKRDKMILNYIVPVSKILSIVG